MTDLSSNAPKLKKDRSPSFPFIPLKTAVERLEAFEKHFGRHPTPASHVGPAWGFKGLTSQADQTLAALRSYGLVIYEGIGPKRLISVSEDGRRYLRAQQESVKEAALKQAALRPRIIRKFWADWGADRPVDAVALDALVLDSGFSDNGGRAFLKVYDETIAYAKLSSLDKLSPDEDADESEAEALDREPSAQPIPKSLGGREGQMTIMSGERELTTGLLSKDAAFRLIVSGQIGVKEIERLIKKLEIDKEILADTSDDEEDLLG